MTAYELMLKRSTISERISYINKIINEECEKDKNTNTIHFSKHDVENIKSDLYGYLVLIDEELKKR